ncbi:MAG: dihydrofolate reductase family protein, partial [Candidatus Marinimicrobia bacterium]|nr:dihydrofolate reductase family protein [Candidatus Neomarinimicrobiota bacterium]
QIGVGLGDTGLDLSQVLAELGRRDFTSVLVEGGPRLHRSFLEAGLVDEIMLFTAPQPADREVQGHDGLGNAVAVPDDWHTEREADSGGDRLVISWSPEARARLDNLVSSR